MKNIVKLFFLVSLLVLFTSCDPSHDIFFKNKTASNVKVKINLEPKAEMEDLKGIQTRDSIVFILKKDSIGHISFGIGNWSEKQLNLVTKSIKTMEIETSDIKTVYKSKKAIFSVLKENVHGGLNKTDIEINIE